MTNIVKGKFSKKAGSDDGDEYICSMDIFKTPEGRYESRTQQDSDEPDPDSKLLSEWAKAFDDAGFLLRQQAAEAALQEGFSQEQAADLGMVAMVQIYGSDRVRSISHTELTENQHKWLCGQLDSAKEAMRPTKGEEDGKEV